VTKWDNLVFEQS